MTIRERIENWAAGGQLAELKQQVAALGEVNERMVNAYLDGPYVLPPNELVRQLRESYDPQMIAQLVDLMNYEQVGGYGGADEGERVRAVQDSMRMFKYAIFSRFMVNLWTFYALGDNVQIHSMDEATDEIVQEYLDARRNKSLWAKDRIDENSRWLLVTGERFYVHFGSELDGEDTTRSIQPLQITKVYTNPDDAAELWFYERQFTTPRGPRTLYYPDWELYFAGNEDAAWRETVQAYQISPNAERINQVAETRRTQAVMQFAPFIQLDENDPRGWPLLAPHGTPWLRGQKEFMQNRLAVSRSVASYVRRYKTAGGSRAVDAIRSALGSAYQFGGQSETNPPPAAGASEVMNRAIDVEDLPLRTGASDASTDSDEFAWVMGMAGSLYPHMLGRGQYHRMATAEYMNKPMVLQFSLYRKQLSTLFREAVEIALRFREKYGGQSFESYDIEVNTDKLVEDDLTVTVEAVGKLFQDVIWPGIESGQVPVPIVQEILVHSLQNIMQAMGVDSDSINLEIFEQPTAAEAALMESHVGEVVTRTCPLCAWPQALSYPDHGGLLVCEGCKKTYDPEVE